MDIGLIGLGNMGRNLALNLNDRGYKLHAYNRTYKKTTDLVKNCSKIIPHASIKELVSHLTGRRIIILMLTAGKPIDDALEELSEHLNDDDIVIDLGNSYFKDTINRCEKYKFNIAGAGISGGEVGARNGGSIMVGCSVEVWDSIQDILYDLSVDSEISNTKCCERFGDNGAGHFVKMIHNGVEYCDMDIISESYNMLKTLGKSNDDISGLFVKWNEDKLKSYLLEIASKILVKKENGEYLIDKVEDSAQQKGTGKACILEAVELTIPAITIVEATFSRIISSRKAAREALSSKMKFNCSSNFTISDEDVFNSIYLCRAISFIQGFNLLNKACETYNWNNNLHDVCDVWSNGCILRGSFLKVLKKITEEQKNDYELSDTFIQIYNNNIESLKRVIRYALEKGIPIPTVSSCFNYMLGMREVDSNGNMIQCMRDYFGGHTVVVKGEKSSRHIEWD